MDQIGTSEAWRHLHHLLDRARETAAPILKRHRDLTPVRSTELMATIHRRHKY